MPIKYFIANFHCLGFSLPTGTNSHLLSLVLEEGLVNVVSIWLTVLILYEKVRPAESLSSSLSILFSFLSSRFWTHSLLNLWRVFPCIVKCLSYPESTGAAPPCAWGSITCCSSWTWTSVWIKTSCKLKGLTHAILKVCLLCSFPSLHFRLCVSEESKHRVIWYLTKPASYGLIHSSESWCCIGMMDGNFLTERI